MDHGEAITSRCHSDLILKNNEGGLLDCYCKLDENHLLNLDVMHDHLLACLSIYPFGIIMFFIYKYVAG